jgi:hypothetical protein
VDWNYLDQDGLQWRNVPNAIMNVLVRQKAGNVLL